MKDENVIATWLFLSGSSGLLEIRSQTIVCPTCSYFITTALGGLSVLGITYSGRRPDISARVMNASEPFALLIGCQATKCSSLPFKQCNRSAASSPNAMWSMANRSHRDVVKVGGEGGPILAGPQGSHQVTWLWKACVCVLVKKSEPSKFHRLSHGWCRH